MTHQNKSNLLKNDSKSIDFTVTYIEKKIDSFYKRETDNFLKSANVTEGNINRN